MRALEIDDTLSEAHASLGLNKTAFEWNWAAAEEEFKRAIELNPGYATAHQWYAWSLAWMSRFDEAIEEMKRARDLDPLSLIINTDVGVVYFFARQYDLAIESLQKAIEMDPTFSHAHHYLGRAYVQKSMYTEALEAFQKEKEFSRGWDPMMEPWIVITYVKMNKRDQAQRMLDDLVERSKQLYIPPSGLAWVYFVLEENELGFDYLNKAFAGRDQWLCYLSVDPVFDSVRSDPRFKVLLGKMNLEK